MPDEADIPSFLNLMFTVASHQSFAVSISALNLWSRILKSDYWSSQPAVQEYTLRLLELAIARLIRVRIPLSH